jgi:hypothetical protein
VQATACGEYAPDVGRGELGVLADVVVSSGLVSAVRGDQQFVADGLAGGGETVTELRPFEQLQLA